MKHTLALVLACVATSAAAQPAPPAKTADEHYEASKKFYNIEKYDEAVAELKRAYELSPDPVYLFNIAQALRKKGDCAGAIDYYRKYLRDSPDASNRGKVEQWMTELEECARTKPADKPPGDKPPGDKPPGDKPPGDKPPGDKPPDDRVVVPPATGSMHAPDRARRLRIAGLATAGAGGVGLIAGTVLALAARSIANDVEADCADMDGCDWNVRGVDDARGRSRATQARIAFALGGAAVVAGGVMFVLGRATGREAPVAIVPTADGALVSWSRRY